jgi:hypothetical protein
VFFLGIIYISLKLICYISQFLHTVHYNYILFFYTYIHYDIVLQCVKSDIPKNNILYDITNIKLNDVTYYSIVLYCIK